MKNIKSILLLILILVCCSSLLFSQSDLKRKIESLEGILSVQNIPSDSGYAEAFKIFIEQPLDHNQPDGKMFRQKFYLSHRDYSLPMVIELDGYKVNSNRKNELATIFNCNKIELEHRYFGESVPDSLDWKYLTIKQAADDDHRIIETMKNLYKNKWITTGISKGGQTTYIHKYYFPDDADASVCYVAPLNISQEDPRIYHFLDNVGTAECRNKMIIFQREVLKRADDLIPLLKEESKKFGYRYSLGNDRFIFEYIVLEYGFAFWQWQNTTCEQIPDSTASNEVLFEHLKKGSSFDYFSDKEINKILPFFYQAYSQMGYYGYDISEFKDLLTEVKEPTSKIFISKNVKPFFDCCIMQKINEWIQKHGNNMIFIYGGNDTWSATSIELTGETNSIKMVKKGGSHRTRIRSFNESDQKYIINKLEEWMDYKIP
ncbi:MAG: S28 family serine protease [Ignavibacteriaceae bacterium]|nr:S28 family serine protease [Chlorobium sp.]MCW8823311.1 S28 family serine protease [Ignavibacteriaceae bacterium]MCW9094989.1 S28 family serine protease [Ignavibacteriaceae bacterium]